jgi:hypothetical protein
MVRAVFCVFSLPVHEHVCVGRYLDYFYESSSLFLYDNNP